MNKQPTSLLKKPFFTIASIVLASLNAILLFTFSATAIPAIVLLLNLALILTLSFLLVYQHNIFRTNQNNKTDIKILLVDDSTPNRRITIEILKALPLDIIEASSGTEALALLEKHSFSLILLDIEMQEMSGLEVTKTIRSNESKDKRIPIIAISAHNAKNKKIEALTGGFDDYLSKPISNETLLETLKRWLDIQEKSTDASAQYDNVNNASIIKKNNSTSIKNEENPAFEFIIGSSTDNSATIKKTVDVKQSLVFSRNNHNLAKDMLQMLIKMIKDEREKIAECYKQKNWTELNEITHKINGGTCYCGVPRLQTQTQIIDDALQKNDIQKVDSNFPDFIAAMDELLDWNEKHDLEIIFDQ